MTRVDRPQFKTDTGLRYPDNTSAQISPADIRSQMDNIADSVSFTTTSNTGAPSATDDSAGTAGNGSFGIGDFWVDSVSDTVYICAVNTDSAAVWQITATDFAVIADGDASANQIAIWQDDSVVVGTSNFTYAAGVMNVAGTVAATDFTGDGSALTGFATVAISGDYTDLVSLPSLGTAAATAITDYATAAQGATADTALQDADIGSSVQGYTNILANTTSSYTTAEETKLSGIETGATTDQTAGEIEAIVNHDNLIGFVANEHIDWSSDQGATNIHSDNYTDTNTTYVSSDFDHDSLIGFVANEHIDWSSDQGATNIHPDNYTDTNTTYTVGDGGLTQVNFTTTLDTKLSGIEALADVTDATNVNAAGAVMNSDATTTAMAFVIDEDTLVSNSATKIPTQQSVKSYIDSTVASSVKYKGGYNASTNIPNLDTSPSGVATGDMYTVTVAGTFFSTSLEVGDVLIAEQDDPTIETQWTVVNKDLNAASIKVSYESNADTNAFTDAEQTKLTGIETAATADQTPAQIKAAYEGEASAFTDAQFTKLGGIETAATADQTAGQIEAAVNHDNLVGFVANEHIDWTTDQGATNINAGNYVNTTYTVGDGGLTEINFTTADNSKLDGIDALADVTDTTNVTAAGALMDSEVTNLAAVKAFDGADYATAAQGSTADTALQSGDIGSTVQAYDADALKADVPDNLTAGFTASVPDDGTQSGGTTYTPSVTAAVTDSNYKQIVNGGAFPLAAPTLATNTATDIVIFMTNNASAGAVTTSAIDNVSGDAFTTTDGDKFILRMTILNIGGTDYSTVNVEALP
jgi:hypothetical protein